MAMADNDSLATGPEPARGRWSVPLAIVPEERLSAALDAKLRELLCTCFPADAAIFSRTRHWHGSAPAYSVVCEREDRVLGHVGMVVRDIRCDQEDLSVAGVQNFAVHADLRGSGVGARLIRAALAEGRRREIDFGLLFCVPALEKYYRALGWSTVQQPVVMLDDHGARVPTPEKNICMIHPLRRGAFPTGTIDLRGRDW